MKVLHIELKRTAQAKIQDWKFLRCFPNLKKLTAEILYLPENMRPGVLFDVLQTMENITDLTIIYFDEYKEDFEAISLLTQLEAFDLDLGMSPERERNICCDLSDLTKLTKLRMTHNCPFFRFKMVECTGLVNLRLPQCFDLNDENKKALSGMTRLRDVDISVVTDLYFPSKILQNWRELRRLRISLASMDEDFFPTIAEFLHLTDIDFYRRDSYFEFERHMSKIKLLNLKRLAFHGESKVDPLAFFTEGRFPRLRSIRFYSTERFSNHFKKELGRRLPCLREIVEKPNEFWT